MEDHFSYLPSGCQKIVSLLLCVQHHMRNGSMCLCRKQEVLCFYMTGSPTLKGWTFRTQSSVIGRLGSQSQSQVILTFTDSCKTPCLLVIQPFSLQCIQLFLPILTTCRQQTKVYQYDLNVLNQKALLNRFQHFVNQLKMNLFIHSMKYYKLRHNHFKPGLH